MSSAKFTVIEVFDLPVRQGLLVTGRVEEGVLQAGTRFVDPDGTPFEIISLEFLTRRNREEGSVTITIPRDLGRPLAAGDVLIEAD
jgi:hypothetical protein